MQLHELINRLGTVLPGFREYLSSGNNYFGIESPHAVFCACSHYVREHPVANESWTQIADLVNALVGGADGAADEAACTCFLENLANPSHPLRALLKGAALSYWQQWEGGV